MAIKQTKTQLPVTEDYDPIQFRQSARKKNTTISKRGDEAAVELSWRYFRNLILLTPEMPFYGDCGGMVVMACGLW